jgi:hypothetical protein
MSGSRSGCVNSEKMLFKRFIAQKTDIQVSLYAQRCAAGISRKRGLLESHKKESEGGLICRLTSRLFCSRFNDAHLASLGKLHTSSPSPSGMQGPLILDLFKLQVQKPSFLTGKCGLKQFLMFRCNCTGLVLYRLQEPPD